MVGMRHTLLPLLALAASLAACNPDPATVQPGIAGAAPPPEKVLLIDDFESANAGWQANRDTSTSTTITCTVEPESGEQGSASLRMDYSVASGSWATCVLLFDSPQDWSEENGWPSIFIHRKAIYPSMSSCMGAARRQWRVTL